MRRFPPPSYLFLDFDGVICDSLEECFRSSWLTGEGIAITDAPPPNPPFDAAYRARFDSCRPFIRSGEDYLIVHQWAARGQVPADQASFDRSLGTTGLAALAEMKKRLYAVRDHLLEKHRSRWLGWNPLYPGMAEALKIQASNPRVWILSTKKAEFIVEILAHHGVVWPLERTIYTGTRRKLDIIGERIADQPSMLIDDQVDHLDPGHPSCRCLLALWGYISPGATEKAETVDLPTAVDLISRFPVPRRSE